MSTEHQPPDDYAEALIQARIELNAFEEAARAGNWPAARLHAEDARLCISRLCQYSEARWAELI